MQPPRGELGIIRQAYFQFEIEFQKIAKVASLMIKERFVRGFMFENVWNR